MTETTAPQGARTYRADLQQRRGAVEAWLAAAHTSPAAVRREWSSAARLALIPLGQLFEAVRIPASVTQIAFSSDNWAIVAHRLAEHLYGGPVIHDPEGRRYYALVPPGTAAWWRAPAAQCLGEDTYLGVPRTDLTELDARTRFSYWAVPMTRPGILCNPDDVLPLVMVGGCLADDEGDDS